MYPAFIGRDRPHDLGVDVAFAVDTPGDGVTIEIDGWHYRIRPSRQRLHPHGFRAPVLIAYRERCVMCGLLR